MADSVLDTDLEEKYWDDNFLPNHHLLGLEPLSDTDFIKTSISFWKNYLGEILDFCNMTNSVVRLALEMGSLEGGDIIPYFHDSVLDISCEGVPMEDELSIVNNDSKPDSIPDDLFDYIKTTPKSSKQGLDSITSKSPQYNDRFFIWYKGLTQAQRKIMTSCTCLVLLRCIVMSPDSVSANIRTSHHANLTKWCGLPKSKGEFVAPADFYVGILKEFIRPYSRLCQIFVSRILKAYQKCQTSPFLDVKLEAIYKQTFLQHTFCFGMKVIDLISSLTKKGHKWVELIERLPEKLPSQEVEPLKLFLKQHFTTNNPDHSLVFWCRMLDKSYHRRLNGVLQPVILANLVAIQQPNLQANIWKMKALDLIKKSGREKIVSLQKEITKKKA